MPAVGSAGINPAARLKPRLFLRGYEQDLPLLVHVPPPRMHRRRPAPAMERRSTACRPSACSPAARGPVVRLLLRRRSELAFGGRPRRQVDLVGERRAPAGAADGVPGLGRGALPRQGAIAPQLLLDLPPFLGREDFEFLDLANRVAHLRD